MHIYDNVKDIKDIEIVFTKEELSRKPTEEEVFLNELKTVLNYLKGQL